MISEHPDRNKWLTCEDTVLLQDCHLTEFQSSGPGGQKRNRKYSSIRIAHSLSGRAVTAVKSRSQNENKRSALSKLRRLIAMEIRSDSSPHIDTFVVSMRNKLYPLLLALLFDTLHKNNFSVGDTGKELGLSTGRLVKLLAKDTDAWQKVNKERQKRNLSILKT
jgi:peptide chain release factor-like protein